MPIVTPQDRPIVTQSTEDSFRYPKKTITQSTGMDISKTFSGAPIQETPRQESTSVETSTSQKEVSLSPQLTALARKEQKIRQQEQALKAEKDALVAERAEIAQLKSAKQKLSAKDYSILDELGVSYEEWTNYLINKGTPDPNAERIKQLESKLAEFETNQKQNTDKQYEATIKQYERDISKTVESNPKYKGIKDVEAEKHVLQHILDTFKEEGEVLTVQDAVEDVLGILKDDAKKMQALLDQEKPVEAPQKTLPPPRSGLRTLTNQIAQTAPSQPRNQFQHMSPKERIAAAIAKAQKQS
jgi:hypothetical protein